MLLDLLVVFGVFAIYWFPVRRWMGSWGATGADAARVMAGDGLIPAPLFSYTTAVEIQAQPEHIWPWLAQLGYRRGGLYSYDWLDRLFGFLDGPSATAILPEFQNLAAGDVIPIGRGPSWPVAVADRDRALVLDMRHMNGFDWVWQFGLYRIDETHTRLVSRSRVRPHGIAAWLFSVLAIEPSGFFMTRRMLLGIKERAERLAAASAHGRESPAAA